jgi:hypothetical protein
MADEIRRAQLKEMARLRAMYNYNQSLQRIDWNMDVVQPRVKQIAQQALTGKLPEILPIDLNEYRSLTS